MKSYKSSSGGGGSSALTILVNGVSTPVQIDTANPANTVAVPTMPFSRVVDHRELDTFTTSIDNTAWVQFVASTPAYYNEILISNKTGVPLQLGTGAPGSEQFFMDIPAEGLLEPVYFARPAGTRITLRCLQATTVNAGVITLDAFGV